MKLISVGIPANDNPNYYKCCSFWGTSKLILTSS